MQDNGRTRRTVVADSFLGAFPAAIFLLIVWLIPDGSAPTSRILLAFVGLAGATAVVVIVRRALGWWPGQTQVWVPGSAGNAVQDLKDVLDGHPRFRTDYLSPNGGRIKVAMSPATWGAAMHLRFTPMDGGTIVRVQWRPNNPVQVITWGAERRDLAEMDRLLDNLSQNKNVA